MTDELEKMSPNQRRALDKALSALEAFASIWAAEIHLSELSARIAAVPTEAERAKRIAAMIEQGFIEGAYRHYLDHKDKCDELAVLQAARATPADHIVDANKKVSAESVRDAELDSARLDYLDMRNARKNEQYGTKYGWQLNENHNRIALEDHAWPGASVRAAIDQAMKDVPL